jgi:hypothetical protein
MTLGRRELRRNLLPTSLVVLLIALPTALAATVLTLQHRYEAQRTGGYLTNQLTLEEVRSTKLPPGVEVEQYAQATTRGIVDRTGEAVWMNNLILSSNPLRLTGATLNMTTGSPPRKAGEIAVDVLAIEVDGIRVGDRIRLGEPANVFTVTGSFVQRVEVGVIDVPIAAGIGDPATLKGATITTWFKSSNEQLLPMTVFPKTSLYSWRSNTDESRFVSVFAAAFAVALMVVSFVAAAAITVVGQRRMRAAQLLQMNGGGLTATAGSLVSFAAWCGAIAGVVGSAVGVLGVQLLDDRLEIANESGIPFGGLLIIVVSTVVSASLAAIRPALVMRRTASSLHGSGQQSSTVARWRHRLNVGAGVCAVGASGLLIWVSSGPSNGGTIQWFLPLVLAGVGISILMPAAARTIGRVGKRLPTTLHLSARSIGRSSQRSGAVLAAIVFCGGLTSYIGAQANTSQRMSSAERQFRADAARMVMVEVSHGSEVTDSSERIIAALQPQSYVQVEKYSPAKASGFDFAVGNDALWETLNLSPSNRQKANAALSRGEAISVSSRSEWLDQIEKVLGPQKVTAILATTPDEWPRLPVFVNASDPRLKTAILQPAPLVLMHLSRPMSADQARRLDRITFGKLLMVRRGAPAVGWSADQVALLLASIGALFTLLVTIVAVALQSNESRRDRAIMASLGSSTRMGSMLAASSAWLLASVGMLIAVPGGIGASWLNNVAANQYSYVKQDALDAPWRLVLSLAVGAPLLSAIVIGTATACSQLVRRRSPLRDLGTAWT